MNGHNVNGTMHGTIKTSAPPYHIQTNGSKEIRDGFPYFAHHQSVSALWSQKWRKPCSMGVYPFMDANVTDFDPIFRQLAETSHDDPAILYRPDDYTRPFLPVGKKLVSAAETALSQGDLNTARDLFLRAAAVYRIARFPIARSPLGDLAWTLGKAAYERAGVLLSPPNIPLAIPFTHANISCGDLDVPIQAYLRLPHGEPPQEGWPIVLFVCGLDAYRTDHTPRTQQYVEAGYAMLSFEIPGTGDCPAAPNDPESPDRLVSSVLEWVHDPTTPHPTTPNPTEATYHFDTDTILVRGMSTGGYYAFRMAHTHADQLFAVVSQGGGCHHMFDAEWIRAQDQMEYPFALAEALAWKFGYRPKDGEGWKGAVERYAQEAGKFSLLNDGVLAGGSCKLLTINGKDDSIFPIEDSFLVTSQGGEKDLVVRGDRAHIGNPGAEHIIIAWINNVVAGRL